MRRVIAYVVVAWFALTAFGRTPSDSVKVYFRVSSGNFEPLLERNAASMDSFFNKIRTAVEARNLDYITIKSYASPDGPISLNDRLARERGKTIADYITGRTGVAPELIRITPGGVAWDELRRMVAENPEVPMQARVLDILDNTPLWIFNSAKEVVDGRKKRLMTLAGGAPYRWMLTNLFPRLRNAAAVSVYFRDDCSEQQPAAGVVDTLSVVQQDNAQGVDAAGASQQLGAGNPVELDNVQQPLAEENEAKTQPAHLAIKTNVLYYGALMPNLELEYLFNKHWSVAVEGNVAWWGHYAQQKSYRLAIIDAEARRWIKPRALWHGMYVGLFAGGGWYDFLKGEPGYHGEGVMAGASFGYMWPIGKHFSLETGLGAGYMYTRYKEYKPYEGHHIYQRTKSMNYFGPLKLKFSLVWHPFDASKRKRTKSKT